MGDPGSALPRRAHGRARRVPPRRVFWAQVADFAALGKTILFSTHNLDEADAIADRVVIIHQGRIFSDGTPRALKAMLAGRTVEFLTDAPDRLLQDLPGVRQLTVLESATTSAIDVRRVQVQTGEAEPFLKALFATSHFVADLIVAEASLEEAFMHLTAPKTSAEPVG